MGAAAAMSEPARQHLREPMQWELYWYCRGREYAARAQEQHQYALAWRDMARKVIRTEGFRPY